MEGTDFSWKRKQNILLQSDKWETRMGGLNREEKMRDKWRREHEERQLTLKAI